LGTWSPERPRRQKLGRGVGDPARRLVENLAINVGAERPQKLTRRALHGCMVDAAEVGIGVGRPGQCERRATVIVHSHVRFASWCHEFLPSVRRRADSKIGASRALVGRDNSNSSAEPAHAGGNRKPNMHPSVEGGRADRNGYQRASGRSALRSVRVGEAIAPRHGPQMGAKQVLRPAMYPPPLRQLWHAGACACGSEVAARHRARGTCEHRPSARSISVLRIESQAAIVSRSPLVAHGTRLTMKLARAGFDAFPTASLARKVIR
jgi:hypothetical protein